MAQINTLHLGQVGAMLCLCWARVELMLCQEPCVHLGLGTKAQMNTLLLGQVGAMLGLCWAFVGLMLGQERRVPFKPTRPKRNTPFLDHVGTGPSWAYMSPYGAYVGPMLVHVGLLVPDS
jgi:hypothetical protein